MRRRDRRRSVDDLEPHEFPADHVERIGEAPPAEVVPHRSVATPVLAGATLILIALSAVLFAERPHRATSTKPAPDVSFSAAPGRPVEAAGAALRLASARQTGSSLAVALAVVRGFDAAKVTSMKVSVSTAETNTDFTVTPEAQNELVSFTVSLPRADQRANVLTVSEIQVSAGGAARWDLNLRPIWPSSEDDVKSMRVGTTRSFGVRSVTLALVTSFGSEIDAYLRPTDPIDFDRVQLDNDGKNGPQDSSAIDSTGEFIHVIFTNVGAASPNGLVVLGPRYSVRGRWTWML